MRVDVASRQAFLNELELTLSPKEFDLLVTLIENRGLVLTREQLLERVWGFTFLGDSRTIDVHVRQLRRKLGDACPIQTVWGTGYKVPAKRLAPSRGPGERSAGAWPWRRRGGWWWPRWCSRPSAAA